MKNKINRWIKYRVARLYVKLPKLNSLGKKSALNEEQLAGIKIVKMLAIRSDSEILMAPISDRYFIRNGQIFIVLDTNRITIINSVYHYDIYVNESTLHTLVVFIRRIIERRRSEMEKEMRSKIERSLDHIIKDLSKKFDRSTITKKQ